jgi:two-component system phosphate regulon sensor histidine kinase PhoR
MTGPRRPHPLAGSLRFLSFVILFLSINGVAWVGFFWAAQAFVPDWPPVYQGLAALWAALIVVSAAAMLWGATRGHGRPDTFRVFNDALLRIARGDYSVQVPVLDRRGGPEGQFHTMAANLNAMASSLARIEELRQQFVADVSHEFQSPLTSILGFSQALKGDRLPFEQRERYLGIIEAEARRLSRLADVLLRLNSLEDREGPPDPRAFRLDVQIRQVLVALEPQWSSKSLTVEADLFPVEMTGNQELWTQVWTNLIHNAVKFTPAGGHIQVRLTAGPGGPVAEVEDSGIGLDADQLDRVFERFYKAEKARSHGDDRSGNGLGLALVRRIAELHGARVEALSPGLGLGTTLRVSWPTPGP